MKPEILFARLLYWLKGLRESPVELLKKLKIKRRDKILEIGCAIGYHTFPLAEITKESKVYAVDISRNFIEYAEEKRKDHHNITTICKDAEKIKIKESNFNKIICFNTLHEMKNPKNAMNLWLKHLKKEGKFLYKDSEISPKIISEISKDKLTKKEKIEDIHIFKKKLKTS